MSQSPASRSASKPTKKVTKKTVQQVVASPVPQPVPKPTRKELAAALWSRELQRLTEKYNQLQTEHVALDAAKNELAGLPARAIRRARRQPAVRRLLAVLDAAGIAYTLSSAVYPTRTLGTYEVRVKVEVADATAKPVCLQPTAAVMRTTTKALHQREQLEEAMKEINTQRHRLQQASRLQAYVAHLARLLDTEDEACKPLLRKLEQRLAESWATIGPDTPLATPPESGPFRPRSSQ